MNNTQTIIVTKIQNDVQGGSQKLVSSIQKSITIYINPEFLT